ncbi:hypothetical protein D3C72_1716130 [compost metagenome]
MADRCGIALAPGMVCQRSLRGQLGFGATCSIGQQRIPAGVRGWQQVGGSLFQHRPGDTFQLRQARCQEILAQLRPGRCQQRIGQRVEHLCTEFADHPVAGRIDRGASFPMRARSTQSLQCRIVAVLDHLLQQHPPALQEHCAVVQLDCQQVVFVEAFLGGQQVTDLPTACAEVVAAIADGGQGRLVHHATVGGPQPMAGRIDQARRGIAADRPGRAAPVALIVIEAQW